jgi:redox-sensitive bicupin YhaK (pirin superfamily)
MGFRQLRVINEDRVEPGQGFGTHSHRDMEIISYVLEGALEHRDSMGTGSIIRPGDVQRMSAGTGIRHSEMNPSTAEPVHFLQIWLLPERSGIEPSYEQTRVWTSEKERGVRLIAARNGRDGAITVHQDVDVYAVRLTTGNATRLDLRPGRHGWIQVARGGVTLNDERLEQGDGAALSDEPGLDIAATSDAEILAFDLA